jgi:lactate dehydrogenase-like 2-hydroxyacid dehydrogenase
MLSAVPMILSMTGVPLVVLDGLSQRILIFGPLNGPVEKALDSLSAQQIAQIRILLMPGSCETSRRALAALPNLGLIACIGAGCDGIDLVAARELGIWVTNSPGVAAESVADLAVALLIASTRRIFEANRVLRARTIIKPWPPAIGLTGRKAGIYGLGAIGRGVAARLISMGMHIAYSARKPHADPRYQYIETLLELAKWADALIVCVPATAETVGSVDAKILSALGPEGHLVNVGRGSIVDTSALCDALENGTLGGAGLDVFDPKYADRLLASSRALLTPHIGGSTTQAEAAMSDMVTRNIDAFLNGQSPVTPV